jgi:hypothetical protein
MPATVNFGLPYPGALDEPCDFAQDWCAFTDAAAAVMDQFQAIADRVWPVQPVAKLSLNTTTTIPRGTIVPFDSVVFDNAGYIDFDASNSTITVKRAGRFIAVFNATMQTTFVANTRFITTFRLIPTSNAISHELDLATSTVAFSSTALFVSVLAPFDINVALDTDAAVTNLEIQRASLSVFWHADGAAP